MANSKISALTAATTPLAGTETLPVVQSSATTKVAVSDLTAGRSVSGSNFVVTSSSIPANGVYLPAANSVGIATNSALKVIVDASGNVGIGINPPVAALDVTGAPTGALSRFVNSTAPTLDNSTHAGEAVFLRSGGTAGSGNVQAVLAFGKADGTSLRTGAAIASVQNTADTDQTGIGFYTSPSAASAQTLTQQMLLSYAGNLSLLGNVVQGTAAKGFDFSANTPLAGKTSTILNWYEEGTWTPNQGAGLTLVGAFSSTGKYTRIGRNVTVSGTVTGATSVAVTAAGVITTNLPFTIGTAGHGNATNAANTAFAAVICNTGTTLTSAGAIAATGTITFSATYFV